MSEPEQSQRTRRPTKSDAKLSPCFVREGPWIIELATTNNSPQGYRTPLGGVRMTSNTTTQSQVQDDAVLDTPIKPYSATMVINKLLAGYKKLPPQMLYTYVNDGRIEGWRDENNKPWTTLRAVYAWLPDYLKKNAPEALAALTTPEPTDEEKAFSFHPDTLTPAESEPETEEPETDEVQDTTESESESETESDEDTIQDNE